MSWETDSFTRMLGVKGRNYWNRESFEVKSKREAQSWDLLGGWCETCSEIKVNWSLLHHGTGPSLTTLEASSSLVSRKTKKTSENFSWMWIMNLTKLGNVPMASKNFTNDWIVRLFGNRAFTSSMIRRQVPSHNLHHPFTWIFEIGDSYEQIRMGKVISVHFEQWSTLENESGQHDLRQIHADFHLRQEMCNNRTMRFHR